MRSIRALFLVLSLTACGCPASDPEGEHAPTPAASASSSPTATTPDPPPSDRTGPDVGPPRPAGAPHPDDGRAQVDSGLTERTFTIGKGKVRTWIVDTEPRRRLGLMHVRSLPNDRGMLFVYPSAGRRSFWMKNTYVPLSLAYIGADGTIEQIVDMEPQSLVSHPSKSAVRFVLEVNRGWFRRNGVAVGTRILGISDLIGY